MMLIVMMVWWWLYEDDNDAHSDSDTEADYDMITTLTNTLSLYG